MKKNTSTPIRVSLLLMFVSVMVSCTKDSDLLAEYITEENIEIAEAAQNQQQQDSTNQGGQPPQDPPQDPADPDPNSTDYDMGELKAFPGAEGFGRFASGGRGGIIVQVTNLNDSGPGSLREALRMQEPRTIVFRVGGTIECNDYLEIPIGSGDVTIAGQTAPGGGILIKGGELRISASNVIIRYLRFRQDPTRTVGSNLDGIKIKSFQNEPIRDIIVDHCSVSWGVDENISISNAENVTIQNSLFSECSKNFLIQNSKNVSVLNNLMALNSGRNIRANTIPHLDLTFELINNIIYGFNWGTGASEGLRYTITENLFKSSNSFNSTTDYAVDMPAVNPDNGELNRIENTYSYIENNLHDNGIIGIKHPMLTPYLKNSALYSSGYSQTPASTLESKLIDHVGASKPYRDNVDERIIGNFENTIGTPSGSGAFPSINNGNAYLDEDQDGIEDSWEDSNGLDNQNKQDGNLDKNNDGYTNLEEFLHYLLQ